MNHSCKYNGTKPPDGEPPLSRLIHSTQTVLLPSSGRLTHSPPEVSLPSSSREDDTLNDKIVFSDIFPTIFKQSVMKSILTTSDDITAHSSLQSTLLMPPLIKPRIQIPPVQGSSFIDQTNKSLSSLSGIKFKFDNYRRGTLDVAEHTTVSTSLPAPSLSQKSPQTQLVPLGRDEKGSPKCPICPHVAKNRQHLERHVWGHTGEKPFKCAKCEYKTTQKGNLLNHMKIHSDERPFQCPKCVYKARQKAALAVHLRKHTGDKPYKCLKCDYRAKQKSNLDSHSKANHPTVPPLIVKLAPPGSGRPPGGGRQPGDANVVEPLNTAPLNTNSLPIPPVIFKVPEEFLLPDSAS